MSDIALLDKEMRSGAEFIVAFQFLSLSAPLGISSAQVTPFFLTSSFPGTPFALFVEVLWLRVKESLDFLKFQSCLTQSRHRVAEDSADTFPVQLAVEQSLRDREVY